MKAKWVANLSRNCLLAFIVLLTAATSAPAGDTWWQHDPATPGDWFAPANWNNGLPGSFDYAYIDNGGTAMITSGTARAGYVLLGENGSGRVVQTGGVLDPTYDICLGVRPGSSGTYELAGGAIYSSLFINVGLNGSGLFLQSGGDISGLYNVVLAYEEGSVGTYRLSDTGNLSSRYQNVGCRGKGRFVQTGGTNSCVTMTIGRYAGAEGTYELFSGTLKVSSVYLGGKSNTSSYPGAGVGRFIQYGGIHEADVYLGCLSGGDGTYELKGGSLSGRVSVGCRHTGRFIQTGGMSTGHLTIIGDDAIDGPTEGTYELHQGQVSKNYLLIGGSCYGNSRGEFIQSGGTVTITSNLTVGYRRSSNYGTYSISGGQLKTGTLHVAKEGGNGVFRVVGASARIQAANYGQGSCGTLISEITGDGISLIEVGGPATLGGAWNVEKNGAVYGRFDILTAGEGISGGFDSVALPSLNWTWGIENNHTLWAEYAPLEIAIDIKPGSDPNSINLGAKGVVPVAIFGAEEFDVHDVDWYSLLLEGAGPKEKGKDDIHVAFEYINDDLFLDLIVQFSILELELGDGAMEALLTGSLLDGTEFVGTDAIRLVGGQKFRSKEYSVPEPASASLLLLGGLAMLRRRRK